MQGIQDLGIGGGQMLNVRCNGKAICECDAKDFDILHTF